MPTRPGLSAIFGDDGLLLDDEKCYRHGTTDTKVNCTYCKIEKDVKKQHEGEWRIQVEIDIEPPCRSLNRKEAAQFLDVSVYTLRSWHATKKYSLPFTKIGCKYIRYLLSDLEEFKMRVCHYITFANKLRKGLKLKKSMESNIVLSYSELHELRDEIRSLQTEVYYLSDAVITHPADPLYLKTLQDRVIKIVNCKFLALDRLLKKCNEIRGEE